MKFFSNIAIATTALSSVVLAAENAVSRQFKVQTQVLSGNQDFNGQYLFPYHTGAGENVPTFGKSSDGAAVGYINGTSAEFIYGDQGLRVFLALGYPEDFYALWGPMTLSIGGTGQPGTTGFSIGPSGFLTHTKTEGTFEGWRVCNWVHGVPELFFDTFDNSDDHIPTSCATVLLKPVYV